MPRTDAFSLKTIASCNCKQIGLETVFYKNKFNSLLTFEPYLFLNH
jgi:hypothetical protein